MEPAQIVVVGSYNRDVALSLSRLPGPGETCLALGRIESPGGKGSNQAIQAARCGAATAILAAIARTPPATRRSRHGRPRGSTRAPPCAFREPAQAWP